MIIRYADDSYAHAVISRLTGSTIRVAVPGIDDVEFKLVCNRWTSCKGRTITLEFPPEAPVECNPFCKSVSPGEAQTQCVAGGDCALRRVAGLHGGERPN